jgi:hypothetical protein
MGLDSPILYPNRSLGLSRVQNLDHDPIQHLLYNLDYYIRRNNLKLSQFLDLIHWVLFYPHRAFIISSPFGFYFE